MCLPNDKNCDPASFLQLNKYGTAPNFIQLSQNLMSDWFFSVYIFTGLYQFLHDVIIIFLSVEQFYDRIMHMRAKTGKDTEIEKQSMSSFGLIG